ncbi:MAG: hypothetical protein RBT45_06745 [Acholeplasmataceae bacterium]|jgi:hypothetical protein|nr:hypothetical protein [Acholeplasmataceae bacterium]
MNKSNINYHISGIGSYSVDSINFVATIDYDIYTFTNFGLMINNNLNEKDTINEFKHRALPTLQEFQ